MKRKETTGTGRRLGATTLALVAAGLTAAAFAAFSIAESGDSNGDGKDRVGPAPFAAPGPPGALGFRASGEDREAFEAFRQCMEDQGAEPPRPPSGEAPPELPSPQQREEFDQAFEQCKDELPEGSIRALPMPPPCDDEHGKGEKERA